MIRAFTGETIKIGVHVNNPTTPPTPADLLRAVAKLGFKKVGATEKLIKEAVIVDNYVSGRLEGSETLVAGTYLCELRLWIDGEGLEDDSDCILYETVRLKDAVLKEQNEE